MPRFFLALNLPDSLKTILSHLPGDLPGARWLETDQYHLTLKYFGVLSSPQVEKLQQALSGLEFPILPLKVKNVGLFPLRGTPETLWVGVDPSPLLLRMQKHLESHLARHGFEREGRQYFPHISLARLRDVHIPYLGAFLSHHSTWQAEETTLTSFSLYSSHGTDLGSHYEEEIRFPLFGVTGDEDNGHDEYGDDAFEDDD